MRMDQITSLLAILLASCWILDGAKVTPDSQMYGNTGVNDEIFTDSLTFESTSISEVECAAQCDQHDSCETFTFHQNTCRGHGHSVSSYSATQSASGARSFVKESDRCEGTGVRRLRDTALGLNTDVYCDDGWLVFQKRQDGSVDFYRNWDNYTNGFGDVNGEYWLGLESLHRITGTPVNYTLRVDLMKFDGTSGSAFYSNFSVGPGAGNYSLYFDSFVGGNAGNHLGFLRGIQFSTPDADHDMLGINCAANQRSAWWYFSYSSCVFSHLNGIYKTNRTDEVDSIIW